MKQFNAVERAMYEYIVSGASYIQLNTVEPLKCLRYLDTVTASIDVSEVIIIRVSDALYKGTLIDELSQCQALAASKHVVTVLNGVELIYNEPKMLILLATLIEQLHYDGIAMNIVALNMGSDLLPNEVERYTVVIDVVLPQRCEILTMLDTQLSHYGVILSKSIMVRFAEALIGLSEEDITLLIHRILALYMLDNRVIDESALHVIHEQKRQVVRKSGILEFVIPNVSMHSVGGLKNLKHWIVEKKSIFNNLERAISLGLDVPKGILMFGMPGSGKSLTSKVIANYLNLPLLRLDMGVIYGESSPEYAIKRALMLADTIAPCVFWVDEIEKALAGSDGKSGNDVAIKILGILLTWMQERTSSVFVVATANDISMIRPELYRDGRIDEKFFLGFLGDDIEQIEQIINLHLKVRLKERFDEYVRPLDYKAIAKKMEQMVVMRGGAEGAGYTGANMEALVIKVLQDAYVRDARYIETQDFIRVLNTVFPQHGIKIKEMIKNARNMEAIYA